MQVPKICNEVKPIVESVSTNEALNKKCLPFYVSSRTKKEELAKAIQDKAGIIKFINKNFKSSGVKNEKIGNLYFAVVPVPARRKICYKLYYS